MAGTYLPEIVAEGNRWVRRWGDRGGAPVRVWIAPGDSVAGWRPTFARTVREAFGSWEQAGVPVRFAFVGAPDGADVRVTWAPGLEGSRAGVTHWTADGDGWVGRVDVVFATRASDGRPADEASMRRIALHELGHLLGLEHSADADDVMAPWVRADELTARDRATARLLYALPPGAVAGAAGPPAR
jgi:hypothetical protein